MKSEFKCTEYNTINILKGVAVLGVLLGHSIQRGIPEQIFTENIIVKLIYTFHMPLFVVISGYLLFKSSNQMDWIWLKKKFVRLIIPFIMWNLIIWFFRNIEFTGLQPHITFPQNFIQFIKWQLIHPDAIIWFLYLIFICNTIFFIVNKLPSQYFGLCLLISWLILNILPKKYFGIEVIIFYFPLYVLGYYLAKYKKFFKTLYPLALIASILIYPVIASTWNPTTNNILKYIMALTSITIIYFISKHLKINSVKIFLNYLGKMSLEIYLVQSICLNIGIGSGWIRIIFIMFNATVISISVSMLIKKSSYLDLLLFGNIKALKVPRE